mgnify:CR=1
MEYIKLSLIPTPGQNRWFLLLGIAGEAIVPAILQIVAAMVFVPLLLILPRKHKT